MKKRVLKLKKRKNQKINVIAVVACLLICCCIAISIIIATNLEKNVFFKVEDRQKEIEKSKKEDTEGIETIGWIKVQGTNIDVPLIKYEENINLGYVEKKNFVWTEAKDTKHRNQTKIFGHNYLNLSSNPSVGEDYFTKFEDLMAFTYEDFVKENKYIQYTIGGKDYVYKIFAVFYYKNYNIDAYNAAEYTKEEMATYIDYFKKKSLYQFDIEVDSSDDIILLNTCTRVYGVRYARQFIVDGRLLRKNEKMENYEFNTTEQYEEIQKIMKGVNDNGEEL